MIWLRSAAVGLIAVLIAIPIGSVILGLILSSKSDRPVGVDIVALSRNGFALLAAVLIFSLGFAWEFRRLAH